MSVCTTGLTRGGDRLCGHLSFTVILDGAVSSVMKVCGSIVVHGGAVIVIK